MLWSQLKLILSHHRVGEALGVHLGSCRTETDKARQGARKSKADYVVLSTLIGLEAVYTFTSPMTARPCRRLDCPSLLF